MAAAASPAAKVQQTGGQVVSSSPVPKPAPIQKPPYSQGADYVAKIAIKRLEVKMTPAEEHLLQDFKTVRGLQYATPSTWMAEVAVWSEENGGKIYDWTTQTVQALAGSKFPTWLPVSSLIGGKEGTIISIPYGRNFFPLLCVQGEAIKATHDGKIEMPKTFEECVKGLADSNEKPINLHAILGSALPTITKSPLPEPDLTKTSTKRLKSLMEVLNEERKGGNPGFQLKCKGVHDTVPVHLAVLKTYSKIFKSESFSSLKSFEVEGEIDALADLVNYLYENTLPTLTQPLGLALIKLESKLAAEESVLSVHCINYLKKENISDLLKVLEIVETQDLVALASEACRASLIQSQDASLWVQLYQLSEKKKGGFPAFSHLNEFCVALAKTCPSVLDKYVEEKSKEDTSDLSLRELKARNEEAKKLNCIPLLKKYREAAGV